MRSSQASQPARTPSFAVVILSQGRSGSTPYSSTTGPSFTATYKYGDVGRRVLTVGLACITIVACGPAVALAWSMGGVFLGTMAAAAAYAGVTIALGGTPTREGLAHTMSFGSMAAGLGFTGGVDSWGSRWNASLEPFGHRYSRRGRFRRRA